MKILIKILLPLLITVSLGFSVSTLITYKMSSAALEEASASSQIMATGNAIVELETSLEFNVLNAKSLAQTDLLQPYLDGTPAEVAANQVGAQNRIINMRNTYSYIMLGIINTEGLVLRHTESTLVGKDFTTEPFFQEAMTGEIAVGSPFRYNDMVVYTVASPVYHTETNDIIGVVFNVSRLSDTMSERMRLGDKGYIAVAAKDGLVFIHKDTESVLVQNLSESVYGQTMLASKDGEIYFEENGRQKHAVYRTIVDTGWLVVAAVDVEEVNAPSTEIRNSAIIMAIIIMLCFVGIIYFFVNNIVKALLRAVNYTKRVANGDLDQVLNINTKDEIGQLATSLRDIPKVLNSVIAEYKLMEDRIEKGDLTALGDPSKFSGVFASLISGTNAMLLRFRLVLDSLPSPVVMLDSDLKVVYLNTVAIAMTTTQYCGKTCKDLFNRDDSNTPECGLTRAVETGLPAGGETKAHPNGNELDIAYNAIPMFDDQNNLLSVLQLVTNVTAFKSAQRTIMRVAEEAGSISSRVASASEQLAKQVYSSEQASSEQALRVTETATAMEEMNSTIVVMATNARDASEVSSSARTEAEAGSNVVQQAVESIQVVQMQSIKLKEGMAKLDESARAISEVMSTISDIADQTNLLALNAAIEAARAGEAGRGFSVVADEVRKLAEKTMTSAADVSTAISAIQKDVNESVVQVEESVKAIEESSGFIAQSGIMFETIVDMVENAAEQARNIAIASGEQSTASEEINNSLADMNMIASDMAKNMQEASGAVEELSNQSQALLSLIEEMKTV